MRKEININNWSRKKAFNTFCNFDDPYTGVTVTLNVSNIVYISKNTKNSFYGTMLYFVLMSMNKINVYKYGYGKDENKNICVYKYDTIAATATVLNDKNELNFTRYVKYDYDYSKFMQDFIEAKNDAENNIDYYKIPNLDNMNKVQVTCLPWIRFNNFKDAVNHSEKSSKPKICWGKYYELNGEYFLDFSLLVNHAFQDGYHIAMLINELQNNIYNISNDFDLKEISYVKRK